MSSSSDIWRISVSGLDILFFGYFCFFQVLILFLVYVFKQDNIKAIDPGIFMIYSRTIVPSWIRSLAKYIKRFKFVDNVIYYSVLLSMILSWGVLLYSLLASVNQLNLPRTQRSPTLMPVIPGLTVPFVALGALVLLLLIHEFSHGIFAEKYGVRVKSFGIIYFLCLPIGAYVEIDDEAAEKLPTKQQVNIFGVASLMNLFTGLASLWILRELVLNGVIFAQQVTLFANSWVAMILWFAVLSISIAVVNLLPVPGLDGHKIMLALEKAARSKVAKWIIRNAANLLLGIFLLTILVNILMFIF
jgi:Zn-dependent protease